MTTAEIKQGFQTAWNNAVAVWDEINADIQIALNNVPALCNDAFDAHSGFRTAVANLNAVGVKIPADVLNNEQAAVAALAVPCNNPPTSLAQAIAEFKPALLAFKKAYAAAQASLVNN
ncbi:MAG TPA: hypothetical protein VKT73_15210 [Xanthobacteraceae bacterium]|nr:hypothetical protein [Xanthobacteraceae bacterium]